jgi:hypothetical protein
MDPITASTALVRQQWNSALTPAHLTIASFDLLGIDQAFLLADFCGAKRLPVSPPRLMILAMRWVREMPGRWQEEVKMSIFGNIVSAIFGKSQAAGAATGSATAPTAAPPATAGKPMSKAEVEATIEKIADEQNEKLNWRQSIVDLMKLLKLDSSLTARKQLAQELGYTGALDGSAEMNIWLHKQVMTKLAESGGTVPESLKKKA